MDDTIIRCEVYTNNADVITANILVINKPIVIWVNWSIYHNALGVADFTCNYYLQLYQKVLFRNS